MTCTSFFPLLLKCLRQQYQNKLVQNYKQIPVTTDINTSTTSESDESDFSIISMLSKDDNVKIIRLSN